MKAPKARNSSPAARSRAGGVLAFLGLLGLAWMLRSHGLGTLSLTYDEANSVLFARLGPDVLRRTLSLDSGPPFYYHLLAGWMRVFGSSEIGVRSLSLVSGVLTCGLLVLFGGRLYSFSLGMAAGLLFAAAPLSVAFSQLGRGYAALALFTLAAAALLYTASKGGGPAHVFGHGAATLACLLIHNNAFYLLPAWACSHVLLGDFKKRPGVWAACYGLVAAGYAFWAPVLASQMGNPAPYLWMAQPWKAMGPLRMFWATLVAYGPGGEALFGHFSGIPRADALPGAVAAAAAALGLAGAFYRSGRIGLFDKRPVFLALCVLVPLAGNLAGSLVFHPHYLPGCTDFHLYPLYLVLVARGVLGLRSRAIKAAFAAVLALSCLTGLYQYHAMLSPSQVRDMPTAREAAPAVASLLQEGDALVWTPVSRPTLKYYLDQRLTGYRTMTFPHGLDVHPGCQYDQTPPSDAQLDRACQDLQAWLSATRKPGGRVLAVLEGTPLMRYLAGRIARENNMVLDAFVGVYAVQGMGYPDMEILRLRFLI